MYKCHYSNHEYESPTAYVRHVKACIDTILKTRTPQEASARYYASVYRQSRYDRATPQLLSRHYPVEDAKW